MALIVLVKGANVGGHRSFRPSVLAKEWNRLDVVNVGAAGTFVIRKPIGQVALRAEITRRLPFQAHVMICSGRDILRLVSQDPFAGHACGPNTVRFVSVLAKCRRPSRSVPFDVPSSRDWGVKVIACEDRFVCGFYRRRMKAIGYLGQLEKIFGVPVTTRNWNTVLAIGRILRPGD
jgi:uncharacterized protein (DUF1697 family)